MPAEVDSVGGVFNGLFKHLLKCCCSRTAEAGHSVKGLYVMRVSKRQDTVLSTQLGCAGHTLTPFCRPERGQGKHQNQAISPQIAKTERRRMSFMLSSLGRTITHTRRNREQRFNIAVTGIWTLLRSKHGMANGVFRGTDTLSRICIQHTHNFNYLATLFCSTTPYFLYP